MRPPARSVGFDRLAALSRLGGLMRRFIALALGLLTAFAVAFVPSTAQAATVPSITTMGGPINVLPSAVQSGTAGYSSSEYMAALLYKSSKSPEFWQAYKSAQAAAAAKPGTALVLSPEVAAEAKTIYPAASKLAPLVKGAGGVGAALTAYQMSSTLTNGAADLLGFDATGTVCTSVGRDLWGKVLATAAGANCASMDKIAADFKPNLDASGGLSMTVSNGTTTVSYRGIADAQQTESGQVFRFQCFNVNSGAKNSDMPRLVTKPYSWGQQTFSISVDERGVMKGCSAWSRGDLARNYSPTDGAADEKMMCGLTFDPSVTDCSGVPQQNRPTQSTADPKRTFKCVTAGSDGKDYVGVSEEFLESGGVLPKVKCADLPDDVTPTGIQITETGGDAGEVPVWDTKVNDDVRKALSDTGCGTSTATQCDLQLLKDGKSCFAGADCQGWFTDPNKTSTYRCEYGGKSVALSECTVYAPRWEPEQQRTGDTLGNPTTGEPLKNPKPALDPNSDVGTGAAPAADPDSGTPCWSTSWGIFNPLTWVYRPIQCATQWAFVPSATKVSGLQDDFEKTYAKTAPAQLGTVLGGWDFHPTVAGCSGITVPWSQVFGHNAGDWHLLAVCDGDPLQRVQGAGLVFLALVFLAGGGFGAYRIVGATIKIAKVGGF